MNKKSSLGDVGENLKMARQNALLSNYEASQVYFLGVLHDLQQLLQKPDDSANISKANLQRYRKMIEQEYEQVKEMANCGLTFKNFMPTGGAAIAGANDMFIGDQYETPERDPDVWPPPPPINMGKNIYNNNNAFRGYNQYNGVGFQAPLNGVNPSPKHKEYKGTLNIRSHFFA